MECLDVPVQALRHPLKHALELLDEHLGIDIVICGCERGEQGQAAQIRQRRGDKIAADKHRESFRVNEDPVDPIRGTTGRVKAYRVHDPTRARRASTPLTTGSPRVW